MAETHDTHGSALQHVQNLAVGTAAVAVVMVVASAEYTISVSGGESVTVSLGDAAAWLASRAGIELTEAVLARVTVSLGAYSADLTVGLWETLAWGLALGGFVVWYVRG